MVNEIEEFRLYTEFPVYKSDSKKDVSYMGRFMLPMLLDFSGFRRILRPDAQEREAPRRRNHARLAERLHLLQVFLIASMGEIESRHVHSRGEHFFHDLLVTAGRS